MNKCLFKPQMHDMLPIASDEILGKIETLACHCGCRKLLYKNKFYFNTPKSSEEILELIGGIRKSLNL
jgi:hypothetical protein